MGLTQTVAEESILSLGQQTGRHLQISCPTKQAEKTTLIIFECCHQVAVKKEMDLIVKMAMCKKH
jgi:hypothetical protein